MSSIVAHTHTHSRFRWLSTLCVFFLLDVHAASVWKITEKTEQKTHTPTHTRHWLRYQKMLNKTNMFALFDCDPWRSCCKQVLWTERGGGRFFPVYCLIIVRTHRSFVTNNRIICFDRRQGKWKTISITCFQTVDTFQVSPSLVQHLICITLACILRTGVLANVWVMLIEYMRLCTTRTMLWV